MTKILLVLHWLSRLILAGIFIASGIIKLRNTFQFAIDIDAYRLLHPEVVFTVARIFPWIEVALGLLLLIGWKLRYSSVATTLLLIFFIAILNITYFRGIQANCGCFGSGDKISPLTIARDGLFLIPALFLVVQTRLPKRPKDAVLASTSTASGK